MLDLDVQPAPFGFLSTGYQEYQEVPRSRASCAGDYTGASGAAGDRQGKWQDRDTNTETVPGPVPLTASGLRPEHRLSGTIAVLNSGLL